MACEDLLAELAIAENRLDGENADWWWAVGGMALAGVGIVAAAAATTATLGGAVVTAAGAVGGVVIASAGMEDAQDEYESAEWAYQSALSDYCDCLEANK